MKGGRIHKKAKQKQHQNKTSNCKFKKVKKYKINKIKRYKKQVIHIIDYKYRF